MIPSTEGEGVGERESHMAELPFHKDINKRWKRWRVVSPGLEPRC